jgi:hypothetical protein
MRQRVIYIETYMHTHIHYSATEQLIHINTIAYTQICESVICRGWRVKGTWYIVKGTRHRVQSRGYMHLTIKNLNYNVSAFRT